MLGTKMERAIHTRSHRRERRAAIRPGGVWRGHWGLMLRRQGWGAQQQLRRAPQRTWQKADKLQGPKVSETGGRLHPHRCLRALSWGRGTAAWRQQQPSSALILQGHWGRQPSLIVLSPGPALRAALGLLWFTFGDPLLVWGCRTTTFRVHSRLCETLQRAAVVRHHLCGPGRGQPCRTGVRADQLSPWGDCWPWPCPTSTCFVHILDQRPVSFPRAPTAWPEDRKAGTRRLCACFCRKHATS